MHHTGCPDQVIPLEQILIIHENFLNIFLMNEICLFLNLECILSRSYSMNCRLKIYFLLGSRQHVLRDQFDSDTLYRLSH